MSVIQPFRGLRYDPQKIGDLASVMALPYDVLTERDRDELYQASPYNIVRLIWGKDLPGDGAQENKYLRAARLLRKWEDEGILIRDEQEAFYLYVQDFVLGKGEVKSRRGIIARVRLEDADSEAILPHEETFPEQTADRLQLIRATRANLDPIFAVYEGETGSLKAILEEEMRQLPLIDIRDRWGIRHRLWAIKKAEARRAIEQEMEDRPLFIGDGHHRYEAALQYRREMMEKEGGAAREEAGYHSTLMTLISTEDPGLVILPVHRLIRGIEGWNLKELLGQAGGSFSVEEVRLPAGEEERERFVSEYLEKEGTFTRCFGLYAGGESLYLLTLYQPQPKLDVAILDELILQGMLGLHGSEKEERVGYTFDTHESLRQVEAGTYDLAFLVRATSLQEVRSVSLAGEKMPQKSTYFYPKLLSGLVIHRLNT